MNAASVESKSPMLFQGEYYLATTRDEKKVVLETFLHNDYFRNLVIIDKNSEETVELLEEFDNQCNLILNSETWYGEKTSSVIKHICVYRTIDETVKGIIKETWPLIALF